MNLRQLLRSDNDNRGPVLRALPAGGTGVEIGVWKGEFSRRILKVANPAVLHLIDPWLVSDDANRTGEAWYGAQKISQADMDAIHDQVAANFGQEIAEGRVRLHRGSSHQVMTEMPADSVDYVYIDGDHSYSAVVADLAASLRVTRAGGLIICDDYLLGAWWGDGVVRAVHEFLASAPVIVESKIDSQMVIRKLAEA